MLLYSLVNYRLISNQKGRFTALSQNKKQMKKIALLYFMLFITATAFAQTKQLPTWKTITTGIQLNTSAEILEELKEKGTTIPYYGGPVKEVLGLTNFSEAPQKLDLVRVSFDQLNPQDDYAGYDEIVAAAKALGLTFCPAEVGPMLRLQYLDQPADESVTIVMEPIYYSEYQSSYIYSLVNTTCGNQGKMSKGLKLNDEGSPYSHWANFVFCRSSAQ